MVKKSVCEKIIIEILYKNRRIVSEINRILLEKKENQ